MSALQYSLLCLGILNLGSFLAMGWDKRQARLGKRRIAERTLWGWGLLGGSLGVVAGMWCWRHKTQKASFYGVVYLTLAAQAALLFWWLR